MVFGAIEQLHRATKMSRGAVCVYRVAEGSLLIGSALDSRAIPCGHGYYWNISCRVEFHTLESRGRRKACWSRLVAGIPAWESCTLLDVVWRLNIYAAKHEMHVHEMKNMVIYLQCFKLQRSHSCTVFKSR